MEHWNEFMLFDQNVTYKCSQIYIVLKMWFLETEISWEVKSKCKN